MPAPSSKPVLSRRHHPRMADPRTRSPHQARRPALTCTDTTTSTNTLSLVLVSHRTSSCWMRRLSPPATASPIQQLRAGERGNCGGAPPGPLELRLGHRSCCCRRGAAGCTSSKARAGAGRCYYQTQLKPGNATGWVGGQAEGVYIMLENAGMSRSNMQQRANAATQPAYAGARPPAPCSIC